MLKYRTRAAPWLEWSAAASPCFVTAQTLKSISSPLIGNCCLLLCVWQQLPQKILWNWESYAARGGEAAVYTSCNTRRWKSTRNWAVCQHLKQSLLILSNSLRELCQLWSILEYDSSAKNNQAACPVCQMPDFTDTLHTASVAHSTLKHAAMKQLIVVEEPADGCAFSQVPSTHTSFNYQF